MTKYTDFVRTNIHRAPAGMTPKDRMRGVAQLYKSQHGGAVDQPPSEKPKQYMAGGKATRGKGPNDPKTVAPAPSQLGGSLNLGAANQFTMHGGGS